MKKVKWMFYFTMFVASVLLSTNKILIEINKSNINSKDIKASVIEKDIKDKKLYLVKRVIDGDTIVVVYNNIEEKIRLIGVNTPETVDPRKKVECFGVEASSYTKENILNRYVSLIQDESQLKQDKYGRILAYVYRDDGFFLNSEIIKNGYGYEYTYSNKYKYQDDFKNLEAIAKQNKYGLWNEDYCNKK